MQQLKIAPGLGCGIVSAKKRLAPRPLSDPRQLSTEHGFEICAACLWGDGIGPVRSALSDTSFG